MLHKAPDLQHVGSVQGVPYPVADMHAACPAVERRRRRTGSICTASIVDVMAWMRAHDPSGVGLPINDAGTAAVLALFASLQDLARG